MSDSYKKPFVKDNGKRKAWAKKQANKKVRRTNIDEVDSGKAYRKQYNPWNICDWISYLPEDKKARRK